jgi:hypothetical protein
MDDKSKWIALLQRDFQYSAMNDTKWKRLEDAVDAVGLRPRFRVKTIAEAEAPEGWESGWPEHLPFPRLCIEWLEVDAETRTPRGRLVPDAVTDHSDALAEALERARIPFTRSGCVFRILAHVRRQSAPKLQE